MEMGSESYDVIVVGSGYGGSVAACRLSMAGASVCLIEKGKQWGAQDFPTNSFNILAASKVEFRKWGLGFGSDKALFQAGCFVKTECEVNYIIKTAQGNDEENKCSDRKQHRRWQVYFDSLEHVSADFVVLSAGVLGTTKILFQSERRGLSLSSRLGYSFSCNGNNVAYIAGSQAPLNAYGLDKRQFTKIPLQNRPGPTITSSYTSSLGFTVQTGVLPTSYPYMLFKGITIYGWPNGSWFLHGLVDKVKHLMGLKASQAMVLNVMGYDSCDGRITLDKERNKIRYTHAHDPLLPRKIQTLQSITKRLGGILFMSRYRSTSVHLLGGCNAASDPLNGVCSPKGLVFDVSGDQPVVHEGLYVCDASLIPCSVGINPVLTITTAAEYISKHLVQDVLNFRNRVQQNDVITKGLIELDSTMHSKASLINNKSFDVKELQSHRQIQTARDSENVTFKENLKGLIGGMPCLAYLVVKMNLGHKIALSKNDINKRDEHPLLKGKVGGHVVFQAINNEPLYIIDGEVDMLAINDRTPYTQYMHYRLVLASVSGSRYLLEGKKVMNRYILAAYAWQESRTLRVSFKGLTKKDDKNPKGCQDHDQQDIDLKGELQLSAFELLKTLISMRGNQKRQFVCLLLQSLWRTYITQIPLEAEPKCRSFDMNNKTYPPSILYELKTGDEYLISCQQWRNLNTWKSGVQRYPVLLLNGHSAESFCLPTEPTDLVRTLVEQGYQTWVLQSRVHPQHASNNFTIEDIGKFDIPAVITKIQELHGLNSKIHVIAHCIGGLSIHIALLGGHVSAAHIASLSCVNSSMFFKLTTSALVKMRLPLIQMNMAILGKNKIISMFEEPDDSFRHWLVKSATRLIPRHECCTLSECNLFSGIFGNAFWHENVSYSIHQWLNKQNVTKLPLSAFPHLQKICTSGFIVDPKGRNKYLIHPERMAVPTLYVSGGRTLLVTPETTFLAHKYMKLHQPKFKHKRVVIDGFGHSDLLIGEDAHKKVFPHFLSHIRSVEEGVTMERKDSLLLWDGTHDGDERLGAVNYFLCLMMLLVLAILVFLMF
ncbi:hypothetical protein J5N97_020687 [Dioscorea zingiberensis]|uniref:Cholesterol oxidase n=1 Tax=Dioscorea zingiberensis TaxID=325984 RepID=A0A9D5CHP3_9LILI|nr:hypothetical protein J5N97_020687 [Dioscorea zingiberensis]